MSFVSAPWPLPSNVQAGWTERNGGVSLPPFDGFNIAKHVEDNPTHVAQNRAVLVGELIGQPEITWLNQTHSSVVVDLTDVDTSVGQDGSYTRAVGKACCVMTADCLPVYFWDEQGEQVAIAHAGWRGLAQGILLNILKIFGRGKTIHVGIGPAIGPLAFEVGEDVRAAFKDWPLTERCFKPAFQTGKYFCDLPALAEAQLREHGVQQIYQSGLCSYSLKTRFFSYRREGCTGRMANLIWKV